MTPVCPLAYRICSVYGFVPNIAGKPLPKPYPRGYTVETYERNLAAKSDAAWKRNQAALQRMRMASIVEVVEKAATVRKQKAREKALQIEGLIKGHRDIDTIIGIACNVFSMDPADILSPSRKVRFQAPRRAIVLLARDVLSLSYPRIGRALNRDHTTIMHCEKMALQQLERDKDFAAMIAEVERRLEALA